MKYWKNIQDRLYMPFWTAHEFIYKRKDIICKKVEFTKSLSILLDKKCRETNSILSSNNSVSPYLKNEHVLKKKIEDKIDTFNSELKKILEEHESDISYSYLTEFDPILDRLTSIFSNKIGTPYSDQDLSRLSTLAKERFQLETPPGYKDIKKPEPNRYGDYFIWNDMLNYCKSNQKNLLFVSNDLKEDWCEIYKSDNGEKRNLGPRHQLRREFYNHTSDQLIHFSNSELFITRIASLYEINNISKLEEEAKSIVIGASDRIDLFEILDNIEFTLESYDQEVFMIKENNYSPEKTISLLRSIYSKLNELHEEILTYKNYLSSSNYIYDRESLNGYIEELFKTSVSLMNRVRYSIVEINDYLAKFPQDEDEKSILSIAPSKIDHQNSQKKEWYEWD